jgi:transcriptional regulator with XRE-family HTH domain
MAESGEVRRRELAEFLRSRRARITPEQVGLPSGGRRRTPGLRREEVAQLAGVGVTWYTWLEQGREIRASGQVLAAVAGTLRLDPHERVHLFTLAGSPELPVLEQACSAVPDRMRVIIAQLDPFPAVVFSARTDILAFNHGYEWLLGAAHLPLDERNAVLQWFTNPRWRERLVDREENLAALVAQFRASMAEHIAEPAWKCLVKRLRAESPEFEELWGRHDVQPVRDRVKRYRHPEGGPLGFDHTHLWFGPRSEMRLVTYTPADPETGAVLRTLVPVGARPPDLPPGQGQPRSRAISGSTSGSAAAVAGSR